MVGLAARASGVVLEARRDHSFSTATASLTVVTETGGDVLARFLVRARKVQASVALLLDLLGDVSPGEVASSGPTQIGQGASGVGFVEGWRGTIAHCVEIPPDKGVSRLKIVDPSCLNWPALPVAVVDTIGPDFPRINKSFNLPYAGNDL